MAQPPNVPRECQHLCKLLGGFVADSGASAGEQARHGSSPVSAQCAQRRGSITSANLCHMVYLGLVQSTALLLLRCNPSAPMSHVHLHASCFANNLLATGFQQLN